MVAGAHDEPWRFWTPTGGMPKHPDNSAGPYANYLRILVPIARPAVAYVSSLAGQPPPPQALTHELELVAVITEYDEASKAGLRDSLALIADGTAGTLFLPRLEPAARSLREVLRLIDWLEGAAADLVALQPALDTSSEQGRATVALLREIERWEREPGARRPRGRPGMAVASPELARELARMRADGMSLQAIADQLNRARVPTPRGGAIWRPSSVQSALGYRRPRPPAPGAPPPKPPKPGKTPARPGPRHRPAPPGPPPPPAGGER
jgi:hypothetical protein